MITTLSFESIHEH